MCAFITVINEEFVRIKLFGKSGKENKQKMTEEKMKYPNVVAEAKKKWDNLTDNEKAISHRVFRRGIERWILMWDILKAIEEKFGINVWDIVREEIWKHSFAAGQNLAKKYERHGVLELYDAFNSQFEGLVQAEWLELNDKVLHKWNHACPNYQHLKDLGKTEEEIKEMAPYYCLQDIGIMTGFNPDLEVFPQSRLLMAGDPHCTYRVEDHGEKSGKKFGFVV